MKPAYTTISAESNEYGDCIRACVASVFEIPAQAVPHFSSDGETAPDSDGEMPWVKRLRVWARDAGFEPMFCTIQAPEQHWPPALLNFHHMRLLQTEQGGDHWVVYFRDNMVHDPSPGTVLLTKAYPQFYLYFVKR
jgi:hypothetical protein